ncbi:hypothetical protein V8E51_001501 [Hyaloscypha variabilis]
MTDKTTNFLFVDESNVSEGYKVGHRSDISAHVRKHNAKRFNEQRKMGPKQKALQGKRTLVASWNSCPQACGSMPQEAEPIPSDALLESANFDAGNAFDFHTQIIQDDINSCDQTYSCRSGRGCLPASRALRPEPKGNLVPIRTRRKHPKSISPFEPLGAGSIDPFMSYPVAKVDRTLHELMEFSVAYVTPGLVPDIEPFSKNNKTNIVAKSWFSAGLKAPFLFYALAFVASVHRDSMTSSQSFLNSPRALSYKLIVIQKLREYISKGSKTCRDEVILTVLALADHEVVKVTEEERKPFNTPLQTLQWMNLYGNIKCVPEHMKVVLDLIAMRGGIEKIQLPGLAEVIVRGDLVWALNNSSKPVHPPLRIYESYISFVKEWATSLHTTVDTITMAIDQHLQGNPAGLTLGAIAKTRIAVQQQILLLPTIIELTIASPGASVYECCRLSAIIFSVAVLFPIPNTYDVLQTLARQLKSAIKVMSIESAEFRDVDREYWKLLLWIRVLGGIAALDKPERSWYVAQLVILVENLEESTDWGAIEGILERYLWLDSTCGHSGRELWEEIECSTDPET